MSGIIPEEEEDLPVYDDVGQLDEDIYEELPGITTYIFLFPAIDHEEISYFSSYIYLCIFPILHGMFH